jgi:hypothetical protein
MILMILALWLATTGWLFYRDLWPRLLPDEPPPFTIELADEVSEQKIYWKLFENGADKGYAFSWVQYRPDDDTFDVSSEFKLFSKGRGGKDGQGNPDQIVESAYRVTRTGELRRVQAQVSITTLGIRAKITGRVDGPWLRPHLRLASPSFEMDQDLKPVAVSRRGSVLNPLQPLNRIQGLRPGQRWRVPLIDPLEEALSAFMHRSVDPGSLDAEVLPQPETLTWGSRKHTDACQVIAYRGEDYQARTWVRASDGLVVRQEATHHGVTMALQRD